MSGIAGFWNLDGRPVDPSLLAAMSARQSHRGPDGEGRWIQGPVGLACRMLRSTPQSADEVQPLAHRSGVIAMLDGRIDNRDELLASLDDPSLCAESSDAALVLAAYDAHGDRFVEYLNGDFALAIFDPRRRRLLLARDAIGIKPLHYCRLEDVFVFASEIKSLLIHPRVPAAWSDDALADFLVRGHGSGADGQTFFSEVFSMPPAHFGVLTPERFVKSRYWDFDTCRQVRLDSFAAYTEGFADHFARAVRRRLRTASPAGVSVSGGLDSSSIFCVGLQQSRAVAGLHPPLGLSQMSPEGSPADERRFLLDIEREYGVDINRIPGAAPGVMDRSREELWHVEAPFLDALGNRHHAFMEAARRRGVRVLLGGHWGDQMLCDRSYLVDLAVRFRWVALARHLRELPRWYEDVEKPGFTSAFFREFVRDRAPGSLVALAKRVRGRASRPAMSARAYTQAFRGKARERQPLQQRRGLASAHAESLYAEVRNSYHTLCMESNDKAAAMYGMEMAFPFLDRDLLSFLMGVPGEMQAWRGVPKAFLREGLRGIVPAPILERRNKADFTAFMNEGMERDLPAMAECLRSPGLAIRSGFVERDATLEELDALKGRIGGPTGSIAWALQEILSLELWLQVFFAADAEKGSALSHA